MSNVDAPRGAQYVGTLGGGGANPRIEYFEHSDGSPIFVGDFVHLLTTGLVRPANASEQILGVVMSIKPDLSVSETIEKGFGPASTSVQVGVCIEPFALYAVQDSGTNALTSVGENSDIVATDGNTTTGVSAHEMLTTLAGTGQSAQLRRVAVSDKVGNDIASANAEFIVMINEHFITDGVGI